MIVPILYDIIQTNEMRQTEPHRNQINIDSDQHLPYFL